jgi:nitrite reductase (NADH) large subunit
MIQSLRRPALVVVGAGMAAAKFVEAVHERCPDRFQIRMFGAEPNGTYNRILLSSVLAGDAEPSRLWTNPLTWYEDRGVFVHSGVKADSIDREHRVVVGAAGKVVEPYDILVFATGSKPFVPVIEGLQQPGVFLFRTIDDCDKIAEYARNCQRVAVLGGGLLGLEAARGLANFGLEVTVVEMANQLMPQQLDAAGSELLQRKLEKIGLRFRLRVHTTRVETTPKGKRLCFAPSPQRGEGDSLDTDMIVVSCGIQANVDEARAAGLAVERAIVVDDQLRSSDPAIFAIGECAQHRGRVYGLVDPVYEQARVLADLLSETRPTAAYTGSRLATTLKVLDVDLLALGDVHVRDGQAEVVSHLDATRGVYKKIVVRDRKLAGAILLGEPDPSGRLTRLFKEQTTLEKSALELLLEQPAATTDVTALADDAQICNCNEVSKRTILQAIKSGSTTVAAIGACTKAGTGCGSCQPLLGQLLESCGAHATPPAKNKVELMKEAKDGLDALDDIYKLAAADAWEDMTEDDKQRAKWHGLFFRKPTPGNFMLRLRFNAGQTNARQLRVIADLSDEFGKGFCDLTTRQQIQLRWFTLGQTPEIWRRLEAVGLYSKQTGMDNVRGICGCPVAGATPHELFDATPTVSELNDLILENREFTNLPRKFNVTITGCLENCCHTETQDIALVPAYRELDGQQTNGFNVLVGGKQGSGGYRPASPLDVFVRREDAARLCADITRTFRDHGSRATRNRARLAFLIDDRGIGWFRAELERRWGQALLKAGTDLRKKHHSDHLGIHPQKKDVATGHTPHYVGMLVPAGRINTAQLRGVADIAERYGNGSVRITVGQNLVVPNIAEDRIGALADEPLFKELPYDPSPVMRGLVVCTGNDYCGMALIDTKGYALEVARELEKRTAGRKVLPLSMHWSGCPAGCGLHSVATIGLQGCRSRVGGEVVDAAHVMVNGRSGPQPQLATDLMYDVPVTQLADALEPLVAYLPRK